MSIKAKQGASKTNLLLHLIIFEDISEMVLLRLQQKENISSSFSLFSNPHMVKKAKGKNYFFTTRKAPAFQINTFEGFPMLSSSLSFVCRFMPRKLKWKAI
jgi:hypothetical protein